MKIETISLHNLHELTLMALHLWPKCNYEEEVSHFGRILVSEKDTCFLLREKEVYTAFICLSIRKENVGSTVSSPVAYIDAVYIKPRYRNKGLAPRLINEGEAWARSKGCIGYTSDIRIRNGQSREKAGFKQIAS